MPVGQRELPLGNGNSTQNTVKVRFKLTWLFSSVFVTFTHARLVITHVPLLLQRAFGIHPSLLLWQNNRVYIASLTGSCTIRELGLKPK